MNHKAIIRLVCITAFFVIVGMSFRGTIKEEFLGSLLNYKMGDGVKDSWDVRKYEQNTPLYWSIHQHESYLSNNVPPNVSMNFYNETEFHPKCCQSGYVDKDLTKRSKETIRTTGCKCMSVQQLQTLSSRGGNHSHTMEQEDQTMM